MKFFSGLFLFILLFCFLVGALFLSCDQNENSKNDSPKDGDDDDDTDLQDDDDNDDSDECGQGLWDFVDARFDVEDAIVYVHADFEGTESDGTIEHPFLYIGQALDYAYDNSMDGVAVTDGTYEEQILSGVSYPSMKIIGRCPEKVRIEMDSGTVVSLYHQNITFSQFHIRSYGTIAIGSYGENGTVENNVIEMNTWTSGWGIIMDGSGNIRNNTLTGLGLGGIMVDNPTGKVSVTGNLLSNDGKDSVHVFGIAADGAENIQIETNKLTGLIGYGILAQDETNGSITGNTLTDVSEVGIFVLEFNGMIELNKISWNNSGSGDTLYGDGIVLYNSSNITVSENEINNAVRAGIILDATEGVCTDNEMSDNFYGLVIQNQSSVTESGNLLDGNDVDFLENQDRVLEIPESGFQL